MNLESWRKEWGILSKAAALFVEEEGEKSSIPALIRSLYDFSTLTPESRRITYGGEYGGYDGWYLSYDGFDNYEAKDFMIVETGSGIFSMVTRTRKSLCLIDTRVHGRKGS